MGTSRTIKWTIVTVCGAGVVVAALTAMSMPRSTAEAVAPSPAPGPGASTGPAPGPVPHTSEVGPAPGLPPYAASAPFTGVEGALRSLSSRTEPGYRRFGGPSPYPAPERAPIPAPEPAPGPAQGPATGPAPAAAPGSVPPAQIVTLSTSHGSGPRVRFGLGGIDAVCASLESVGEFRCTRTWPSGARGHPMFDDVTRERLDRLADLAAEEGRRVRPDSATVFTWMARVDETLAGPGGGSRTPHVTSQSDFSDFFVERQLTVLNTPEDASIRLSDTTMAKVQRNAPRHLRQIAGTPLGDPDETFRFHRFSAGVTVYVVDGILTEVHDEFRNLFDGRSRVHADRFRSATASAQFESDPKCSSGHGTHVASLAAGYGYGVAKNATIVSVGVQPGCGNSGFASDLLEGLAWVHEHYLAQSEPRAPAVVTMSLLLPGGPAGDQVERELADLVTSGVLVVAAAGNYGEDACTFIPARMPEVVTVAAMDEGMFERWSWSNTGACVDVWAPGENVLGASPDCEKCTAVYSGTSQATPIVAGMIAHMLESEPTLDTQAVLERLERAAAVYTGAPPDTAAYIAQFHETT